jgi:hypothetical protein
MLAFFARKALPMKKTLAVVLAVSIVALLFAGCGSDTKTDTSTKESWLFSLQSGGPTGFDQSSSVLSVPVLNLVGFTDRPNRVTRALTPTEFAALWTGSSDDSFDADPPNASITYWDSDGTDAVAHTVIVEITKDVSGAGNVLSMTLRILAPSGDVLPTKMYRASLFIDGWRQAGKLGPFSPESFRGWKPASNCEQLKTEYQAANAHIYAPGVDQTIAAQEYLTAVLAWQNVCMRPMP